MQLAFNIRSYILIVLSGLPLFSLLYAQTANSHDVKVKTDMITMVSLMTGNESFIVMPGGEKRPIPEAMIKKRIYWQRVLSRKGSKKGAKPPVDNRTKNIIPIAEALQISNKMLEFTHWSPIYNLGKVWGGRVEFKRNDQQFEATYYWYNDSLLDLIVLPASKKEPRVKPK